MLRVATPRESANGGVWASPRRGSNQLAVRGHNERLILQLIRWHGRLTKSEIRQATGLSANAVSVIMRSLENADLVLKEAPIRGRIGQPSSPIRLNPAARHYLGLKIGRRSADLVLIDFAGTAIALRAERYRHPEPGALRDFLKTAVPEVLREAGLPRRKVSGFGIAIPFEMWSWAKEIGVPQADLDVWRDLDPATLLPRGTPWDVVVGNDATAACVAERTFSMGGEIQDAMYLFIGTLIGGGIILNGSVFFGRTGNAGGFGPFRIPGGPPGSDRLIDRASLIVLERMLSEAGERQLDLQREDGWSAAQSAILDRWLDMAADAIAHGIASSLSVIDFEAVVIDGSFSPTIRAALVDRVAASYAEMDRQGLSTPEIVAGHWGPLARAVGAAALPMNQCYAVDQNTLLRP